MRRRLLGRLGIGIALVGFLLFTLFPIYWAVVTSLESSAALFTVDYVPRDPQLGNFVTVLTDNRLGSNILNSLIVGIIAVGLSLGLAVPAAYALGRVHFRGRMLVLYTILGITMFPQIAVLAGMFELVNTLGLINTRMGLALSYLIFSLPLTVWLLTAFMRAVPVAIEEAAAVDGASPLQIVYLVLLPIVRPGLASAALLAFIAAWNELLFALTLTVTDDSRTAPVAILMIGTDQFELPWNTIMAAALIVTVPVVLLTIALQRHIIAGLTAGAVKG